MINRLMPGTIRGWACLYSHRIAPGARHTTNGRSSLRRYGDSIQKDFAAESGGKSVFESYGSCTAAVTQGQQAVTGCGLFMAP